MCLEHSVIRVVKNPTSSLRNDVLKPVAGGFTPLLSLLHDLVYNVTYFDVVAFSHCKYSTL